MTAALPLPFPDATALCLRRVHRATVELRRGTPILLTGPAPLLVVAVETASERDLGEWRALTQAPGVLLLAASRATRVLGRRLPDSAGVVALPLSDGLLDTETLRGLANPTAKQAMRDLPAPVPPPPAAQAALAVAKLARLLPAVLAAPPGPDVAAAAERLQLLSTSVADVLAYPGALAVELERVAEARLPLEGAEDARIVAFRAADAGIEHLAIVVGEPDRAPAPLVRVHSACFTGDLLGSLRCDCGPQLRGAIRRIAAEGHGAVLYLAQEGRGIGLVNKLRAYALQDRGLDTLDANRALGWGADERNFLVAATMLRDLGIPRLRLLTNNPHKLAALAACGVEVLARERHAFAPNGVNDRYLATKAKRFGHLLG